MISRILMSVSQQEIERTSERTKVGLSGAIKRDNITKEKFDLREKASIEFDEDDFDYVLKENDEKTVKSLVKLL